MGTRDDILEELEQALDPIRQEKREKLDALGDTDPWNAEDRILDRTFAAEGRLEKGYGARLDYLNGELYKSEVTGEKLKAEKHVADLEKNRADPAQLEKARAEALRWKDPDALDRTYGKVYRQTAAGYYKTYRERDIAENAIERELGETTLHRVDGGAVPLRGVASKTEGDPVTGDMQYMRYHSGKDGCGHRAVMIKGDLYVDGMRIDRDGSAHEVDRSGLSKSDLAAIARTEPPRRYLDEIERGCLDDMEDPTWVYGEGRHAQSGIRTSEGYRERTSDNARQQILTRYADLSGEYAAWGDSIERQLTQRDMGLARSQEEADKTEAQREKALSGCTTDRQRGRVNAEYDAKISDITERASKAEERAQKSINKAKSEMESLTAQRDRAGLDLRYHDGLLTETEYRTKARALDIEVDNAAERKMYHTLYNASMREGEGLTGRTGKSASGLGEFKYHSYKGTDGCEHRARVVAGMLFVDGIPRELDEKNGVVLKGWKAIYGTDDPESVQFTAEEREQIQYTIPPTREEEQRERVLGGLTAAAAVHIVYSAGRTLLRATITEPMRNAPLG